jgi:aminoglycoside 6'-N-acetyltransferase
MMGGVTGDIPGERVVLRPLAPEHAEALRAIHSEPAVAAWWGHPEDEFPLADEPTAQRYSILVDGEVAGLIQYTEETEPNYRYAEIDLYLATRHHGKGFGRDAILALCRHLEDELEHHRLVIVPSVDNAAAIRAYEAAGFERVGITKLSAANELTGEWGDEILMERVTAPKRPGQPRWS